MNRSNELDVRYIAHLARMTLSDEEATLFQRQLEDVLGHVATLGELDVDGVEPTQHAVPVHNVFRTDTVTTSLSHEQAMANAPQSREGLFMVPKILE